MAVVAGVVIVTNIFFNDTATTEIYTLSLHDALPIFLTIGPGDFLVHHAIALGLHVTALILVKGALDARVIGRAHV